jgi:hypothetical protein
MKSLIASGLVVVSVALAGTAAQAASVHVHKTARVAHAVVHRGASGRVARVQPGDTIGQFMQFFFGGAPWRYAGVTTGRHSAFSDRSSSESSTFDTSVQSPTYDSAPSSGPDTTAAAIQSMNDEAALNASMAAAEQQNEAAQAAAIQTEINAGM